MLHTHILYSAYCKIASRSRLKALLVSTLWIIFVTVTLVGCIDPTTGKSYIPPTPEQSTPEQYSEGLGGRYPAIEIPESSTVLIPPGEGQTAPEFLLRYNDGTIISSNTLRGQPVLLNFWATWCAPCRREMPDLVTQFETNKELQVIAVNQLETMSRIQPFVEEFQMSMVVATDNRGEMRKYFGVKGLPTSIFIDREGKIVAIWSGYLTDEHLQDLLAKIL